MACPPPSKQPATQIDDIADCVGTHLSDSDKYRILTTHFNPEISKTFPKGKDSRSFQHQWLRQFSWLVYSSQRNGGYCLPCVLFATRGYHNSDPGVLVSKPVTNFKKALDILRNHVRKEHHVNSIVHRDNFLKVMSHQQPSITSVLNQTTANQIFQNRLKLASIIKTIVGDKTSAYEDTETTSMILKEILPAYITTGTSWPYSILG